ncbi:MAG: hypothetical protein DRP78_05735, partial [Candidatus Omnitrophota bacterium]
MNIYKNKKFKFVCKIITLMLIQAFMSLNTPFDYKSLSEDNANNLLMPQINITAQSLSDAYYEMYIKDVFSQYK